MKIHKGGRVIGEGTYGKILAEPRMPCDNETYEMIKDKKEISKIFKDYRDIMTYDKTKLLLDSKFSSDKDKEKLEKSFIVPEVCNINDEEVLKYSDIYTKEWLGKSAQDNGNIEDFIDEYNAQTVSEMGIMDLHTGIYTKTQFSRDIPSILQSIQKAQNIFEGIRLLERKGMFHGDIKNANAVFIGDTIKIIDIDELYNLEDILNYDTYLSNFVGSSYYMIWPSIVIFLYLYTEDAKNDTKINILKDEQKIMKLLERSDENYKNNYNFKYGIDLLEYFLKLNKLNEPEKSKIEDVIGKLTQLKEEKLLEGDIRGKLNELRLFLLEKFENGENNDEKVLKNIAKMIDIYGYGIIMLSMSNVLLERLLERKQYDNKNLLDIYLKCIDLVYKCCSLNMFNTSLSMVDIKVRAINKSIKAYLGSGQSQSQSISTISKSKAKTSKSTVIKSTVVKSLSSKTPLAKGKGKSKVKKILKTRKQSRKGKDNHKKTIKK